MKRLSRPCYDKPHRCPGWAGGGWKYGGDKHPCDNGSIRTRAAYGGDFPGEFMYPPSAPWRPGYCVGNKHTGAPSCGVITIPWALRYLDPRWYTIYKHHLQNWRRYRK